MKIFLIISGTLAALAIFMHFKQNKGEKMGGCISPSKSFWLFYCIYSWLIFIPFIYFTQDIPEPYKTSWIVFSVWFWIRGVIEMIMMFITKNWTPPIGITHNISCFLVLTLLPFIIEGKFEPISSAFTLFHLSLILSIMMETYYAYTFWRIIGEKTKGDEAVWYANKEEPKFKQVVLVTAIANWPIYAGLIFFTYRIATH
jgi:hypothetical protein